MKIQEMIMLLTLFLLSCGQSIPADNVSQITTIADVASYEIMTHRYDSLTLPRFFDKIISNHWADFAMFENHNFLELCNNHELNSSDSTNIRKFYTVRILHDLFTSQSASGNQGWLLEGEMVGI
jgi:hypothetical protein